MPKSIAIDAKTGKVLLRQTGLPPKAFKKTFDKAFPGTEATIISDDQKRKASGNAVVWTGSGSDLGGYATLNREVCFRLAKRGMAVKFNMLRTAPQVDGETMMRLNELAETKIKNEASCPLVVGFTPMPVQNIGRRVIFFTMMETQGLHPEFVARCNRYPNEIWVPCRFYLDVFRKAGIVKPLHLIPLGVDHNLYVPGALLPALRYEEMPSGRIVEELPSSFRFMSLFGWSYRKGPDVLIKSFLSEFRGDEAHLVIHSRYMGGSGEPQKAHVREEIRKYYQEMGNPDGKIFVCGDSVPIKELPGCFASANCFVFCSRGEGFGLPVVEAGACGVPVISAYNSSMTEYLDDEVAYLVRPDAMAPANEKLCWITEFYRDQLFPVYGEQSIREFATHMRRVVSCPEEAAQKASKFRERVLNGYTWDACASRVIRRLAGH